LSRSNDPGGVGISILGQGSQHCLVDLGRNVGPLVVICSRNWAPGRSDPVPKFINTQFQIWVVDTVLALFRLLMKPKKMQFWSVFSSA